MLKKVAVSLIVGTILTGCTTISTISNESPAPTPLVDSYTVARRRLFTTVEIPIPQTTFTVTLSNGKVSGEYGDPLKYPTQDSGSVTVGDQVVELNQVSFSTIGINREGWGEVFYLAAFEPQVNGWKMVATAELGQQIRMQSLQVENGQLVLYYVAHSPGQDLAEAPNVEMKRSFTYQDHQLQEVK